MKMTNQCLAIIVVAMCLLMSGCIGNLLGGPQNCEYGVQGWACAPNPDASGDGYGSDGSSSPETNTTKPDAVGNDTVGKDVVDVCAPYKYLKGTKWFCDIGVTCILDVLVHTDGLCWVVCPVKIWGVPADTLKFPSTGKLVYDAFSPVSNPHTCDKKAN